jgi:NCAIR mutase (PurE)-related protein
LRPDELRSLLERVRRGSISPARAVRRISEAPIENLGFAALDHQRALRVGFPEVVFGEGKTGDQLIAIMGRLYERNGVVLATRVSDQGRRMIARQFPKAEVHARARAVVLARRRPRARGNVVVLCAGTADLPVAEEALVTARAMGSRAELIADVGVAGIHRLFAHARRLRAARVVVVVAGLEGALPSVVGGLVDRPVIAVPTSVGYGAHFRGLAPLLAMLNSCAAGITVVNVNNGFGAGYAAHLINAVSVARRSRASGSRTPRRAHRAAAKTR